jgi:aminopeptidase N
VRTKHWGDLGWEPLEEGSLVASQPIGAPSWFPCDDHPAGKASYRMTVTAPSPFTVVANGVLESRTIRASTTTWVYEQAEPMASYLATVQIGLYESLDIPGATRAPLWAVVPPRLLERCDQDFGRQPGMMALFEECFGPYPFQEYGVVVTDADLDVPVEAQGLSVFGTNHVDGRRGHERLVAHELAHQWFGNCLTVADWRHIWLNEGFAKYAEWLWSQECGGPPARAMAARAHALLGGLRQDLRVADPGVRYLFDDRVYERGALTLHAVRTSLGDEGFFALLREWTAAHRHSTVTTDAFTALARRRGVPDGLLEAWLYRTALPDLP